MRIKIYILLTVLFCMPVQAKVVTEEQARRQAAEFFSSAQGHTKSQAVSPEDFKLVRSYPAAGTKASGSAPSLYIFEHSAGGYAIISGDDVARPVLGYSLAEEFPGQDIPESLDSLLQWYSDIIEFAREQNWDTVSYTDSYSTLDPVNNVLLNTAKWGQDKPSNNLVPEIDGHKPPIGCVATAIAIVMRYYKWPNRGIGTLPSYSYLLNGKEVVIDGVELGHEYLWDKMPELYYRYTVQGGYEYEQYTQEEASQVARLMYDVAVMCQMQFSPGGSSSFLEESALKLPEFFGYDKSIRYFYRSDGFLDLDWEKMIVDEIDAGRPVLYSGKDGAGHAMVIDGYNGRFFSINFGWGQTYTARPGRVTRPEFSFFFSLTPIDGHWEDLIVYYNNQGIVTHIMPDTGGVPNPVLVCYSPSMGLPASFNTNQTFQLYSNLGNRSLGTVNLDIAYVLYDRQGRVKEIISQVVNREFKADYSTYTGNLTCKITKPLSEGDKILISYKDPSSGNWTPITHFRHTEIVFTSRPLSQLVEIGYTEEPQTEQTSGKPLQDVYLKIYKDIVWKLTSAQDTDNILAYSDKYTSMFKEGKVYRNVLFPDSQEYALVELWLPEGSYRLWLRNPVTNETMTINLEI